MRIPPSFARAAQMFKTKFNDIIDPVSTGELFKAAEAERAAVKHRGSLLLAIDEQNSFMDGGELGVEGALGDIERLCRFAYNNEAEISQIVVSLDSHAPQQIFHPIWWRDENGNSPAPFTTITFDDVESGKWNPVSFKNESLDYVRNLELLGKKKLTIWPYHCIKGTAGHALERRFANFIYFFATAKNLPVQIVEKGSDPLSEMYGIIKPEYAKSESVNIKLLLELPKYEKIFIAGQAASHCVLESVRQLAEYFGDEPDITSRICVLTDCMSSITGFEAETEREFARLSDKFGIRLVKSE